MSVAIGLVLGLVGGLVGWRLLRSVFEAGVFQRTNYRGRPVVTGAGLLVLLVVVAFEAAAVLAEVYADSGGRDKRAVGGLLAYTFLRHESIHLLTRIDAISFPEPGHALATVYAAMAGGPIPGAGALTGRRADLFRFDFVFAEEEPTRWLLVRAGWRRAHTDDFL